MATTAGKPIKIQGIVITPKWDWSADYRRGYGAQMKAQERGGDTFPYCTMTARDRYFEWHANRHGSKSDSRLKAMHELASRPNMLEAVRGVRDDKLSTPGCTVYRKVPAFDIVPERIRAA